VKLYAVLFYWLIAEGIVARREVARRVDMNEPLPCFGEVLSDGDRFGSAVCNVTADRMTTDDSGTLGSERQSKQRACDYDRTASESVPC